ncbi:hypothetical protein SAMN04490243_2627 [Robiginitalea myxolifaciens]|uniref:Uncharacterized protein n=1 Tax=Robiginitalea myxolifaciens TaxID=400055 RepID=A0A1I6HED6_9FLAO|nr:hypothetical protein [Robiginitalea myxolifaciens]SFR52728.1 hypothetical protein SAMN04490243_2627 [Robiginitalea myxolifaciens]
MTNFKKISVSALFAVLLLAAACGEQSGQDQTQAAAESDQMITPPKQIISLEEAQVLYKNYSERRSPIIKNYEDRRTKMEDSTEFKPFDVARYGYYDYQTIKDYINYIESEAARANVDISTLRIYFANYGQKGMPDHMPKQNTFMIMPTIKVKGRDYAFRLTDATPPEVILLGDSLSIIGPAEQAGILPELLAAPFQGGSLILNESQIVPPPYNN